MSKVKNNYIGIKMGGYINSDRRIMDRTELNANIWSLQEDNKKMRDLLEALENATDSYADCSKYDLNQAINKLLPDLADCFEKPLVEDT